MASTSRQPLITPIAPRSSVPINIRKSLKSSRKGKGKERSEEIKLNAGDAINTGDGFPEWKWISITDNHPSKCPPVFTKDGRYFFSAVGSSVKIYATSTGQVVSTLSNSSVEGSNPHLDGRDGALDVVTSVILNPHNNFQLITGSLKGCIVVWDFIDAIVLQSIDVGQPIHHVCAHETIKDSLFVAVTKRNQKSPGHGDDNAAVLRISLKPSNATAQSGLPKPSEITAIGKTRLTVGLAISPDGDWIVAIAGHKAYVASTSSLKSGFMKYVSPERLTCLAFHPSDKYFATGDDKGNIRLWYCLNEQETVKAAGVERKAQTTTFHWHAHAAASLAFSSNGAYLLSGGEESVLVIWQLHTGKKEFVPRLGAPIQTIAVTMSEDGEEEYLVGLTDATYAFVSAATLKRSRAYSRIKLAIFLDPAIPGPLTSSPPIAPLAVHHPTSTLILSSSHPSSLQIYSPSSSKLISELEVSPSNRVSRRDEKPIEPTRVERVVISSSGHWMATIDHRRGNQTFRGEVYLKFWWWDPKLGFWILNTRVDRPHGLHLVTHLAFNYTAHDHRTTALVTTGEDGNIKTWRIRTIKAKGGQSEDFWINRSTCRFRSNTPTYASWSPDNSLLAVSLGSCIALYNSATSALKTVIAPPECELVESAHFLGGGSRYLVIVGKQSLLMWDLVTSCVRWKHKTYENIHALATHPRLGSAYLFERVPEIASREEHTLVSVFERNIPSPIRIFTLPFALLNLVWFMRPNSLSGCQTPCLVGITSSWNVVIFGDVVPLSIDEGSSAREISVGPSSQKRSLFQDIFGKSSFPDVPRNVKAESTAHSQPWTGKEVLDIFDGPAYLTPSIESLFDPLMSAVLKPRLADDSDGSEQRQEAGGGEEEDFKMDVDASELLVAVAQTELAVAPEEMQTLVELFKDILLRSDTSPRANGKQTTGANGFAHATANGITHDHPSPLLALDSRESKPKGKRATSPPSFIPLSPSTSTSSVMEKRRNGKKRKKSMG